jgi:hypothetical protein
LFGSADPDRRSEDVGLYPRAPAAFRLDPRAKRRRAA